MQNYIIHKHKQTIMYASWHTVIIYIQVYSVTKLIILLHIIKVDNGYHDVSDSRTAANALLPNNNATAV